MRSASLCVLLLMSACAHRPLSGPIGGADRAITPSGDWLVLCEAREDTNHDGRLTVSWTDVSPFGPFGDALAPYFIEKEGLGFRIDH